MEYDLSKIPIGKLASALLARVNELFEENNKLITEAFALHKAMGPIACIDGIPWRINDKGKVELMALRRRTGPFPGKLVLIGGTIAKGESLEDALQRHFRDDFGVEVKLSYSPLCMSQYRKDKPDDRWMQDPGKEHVVSPVYLVQIEGEAPSQSFQGDPIEWFSEDTMPSDENFGYANHRLYRLAFWYLSDFFRKQ
jgi:ADP-ribose pyrophosphatase YjhB (NUDIX family)